MNRLTEFERSPEVKNLINIIFQYLKKEPPTLGHGFSHFIKTARIAYKLSLLNQRDFPQKAYIAGLLHDIYRPALGESGKEKHETESSLIAADLLNKSNFSEWSEELSQVLNEKDEQILGGTANPLTEILTIADKIEMSFQRGVAYTWASNKELASRGNEIVYKNYIEVMRDFASYQVKAWNIFDKVKIVGVNKAVKSYIKSNIDLMKRAEKEHSGKINYQQNSIEVSKEEAQLEIKFLKQFRLPTSNIKAVTAKYSELL